jgi:hypothetical protein
MKRCWIAYRARGAGPGASALSPFKIVNTLLMARRTCKSFGGAESTR